jgi:hypothetical protein
MQLRDREKITSQTSDKEPKSTYVCRQTNRNKTKSQNKLAAVPENSRAGCGEPGGGAAALRNNNKKATHREKITSRISFSLPPWYDGSSRGVWNHETYFDLRDFLPLFLMMMMMMMMQHATPLSPPRRQHPSFFQNHF